MTLLHRAWVGILFCWLSGSVVAQDLSLLWTYKDAVHPSIAPFIFNFYGPKQSQPKTNRIEILNEATQQVIQIFSDFNLPGIERRFSLIDLNFDGIKDIAVAKEEKGYYYYFIFDKKSGQFHRNTSLEKIPNAAFDATQKQIISIDQKNNQTRKTFYEFDSGNLVLARQEIKTCDQNQKCETTAFVREKAPKAANAAPKNNALKTDGLAYLNSLYNQKAACLSKVNKKMTSEDHAQVLEAQQELSECYKKMIMDLGGKFYPEAHFGQDLEDEINVVVERHHRFLHKMAHCPTSKTDCRFYEQFDVLAGTVDYLSELMEFMVLNVGEGYPDFNPETWLKKWDAVKPS